MTKERSTPLSWTEVRVLVPRGWHELVAGVLAVSPCTTVAVDSPSTEQEPPPEGFEALRTFVATEDDTPQLRARLRAELDALAQRSGARELAGLDLRFQPLPPEDYATSWRKSWKPFRVGRLVLLPDWDERRVRGDDVVMRLEPGGSFGSGRHATTRACLLALQEWLAGGERVLDAGSGSGILSVAALLLGARATIGFDVDENAPRAGRALAEANGVAARAAFRHGGFEVLTGRDVRFDVVLANIYSDVIQERATDLADRLRSGGWFAFSGCPARHREATRAAIESAALIIEEERRRGRWTTFLGRRR